MHISRKAADLKLRTIAEINLYYAVMPSNIKYRFSWRRDDEQPIRETLKIWHRKPA